MSDLERWEQCTNEELCAEYQQTNSDALFEYFLERNHNLAASFARKYYSVFPDYEDDLDQALRMATWRCMKRYDSTRGGMYSTLLAYYVISECQAVIRMRHSIRLPRYKWRQGSIEELEEKEPTKLFSVGSLDKVIPSDGKRDMTVGDLVEDMSPGPEETAMDKDLQERVLADIDKYLSPAEAIAIKKRYGLGGYQPHSLQEIGDEHNVCRERARQLIEKGLWKLKNKRRFFDAD